MAIELAADNAGLMEVVKAHGVSSEVVTRAFAKMRVNTVIMSNAFFLATARFHGLASVVSFGMALKLYAEVGEDASESR